MLMPGINVKVTDMLLLIKNNTHRLRVTQSNRNIDQENIRNTYRPN